MSTDATTHPDPVAEVSAAGVSIWLDDLDRERITSGDLAALARERHVVGVTTNPTIFKKALARASAYDLQVRDLALRGVAVEEAARAVSAWDVRAACDVLRPVFDATGGRDGRVPSRSIRGSPSRPSGRWPRLGGCGGWSTGRTSSSRSRPRARGSAPFRSCLPRASA